MSKKYILITGASSAIGCAIIRHIANDSTVILAHYHSNRHRLNILKNEVPGQIIPIQADLSSEADINAFVESVSSECDFPQKIIFLAAPKVTLKRFKDLSWNDFKNHLDMQLCTSVKVLNRFLPKIALAGNGRVVFMLSSYTIGVPPGAMAHYVTAKYALLGLMKATASEYAAKGITINGVAPSMIETDFLMNIPEKLVEFAAQQHPLRRNATPDDIAPLVKYLLSDEAEYLTGTAVPITGGMQF